MARRRTSLALIANQRTRATTYKKRKAGLIKKAGELATLCDIPVAVVCAGPDGGAPTVWVSPEGREDGDVIARYRALPAEKRAKHTHVVYLQEELDKKKAKLAALQQKGPVELAPPDAALNGMSQDELQQLLASIDATLLATAERREALGLLAGADDAAGGGGRRDADVPPARHGVRCTGTNSAGVHGFQHQAHHAPANAGRLGPATCYPFHPYNAGVTLMQPAYNNVQYMGGHGVDMNGYQLQMQMPSNGRNNGQLAWGGFQPCDATVVQPVYGHLQYWGNNVDGNQMQPAPPANGGWHNPVGTWGNDDGEPRNAIVPSAGDPYMDISSNQMQPAPAANGGWHNPGTWNNDGEPCNMPSAGHPYIDIEGDIDGNYIDTTVFDYQTTSTSDNFMDAPVQFLTTGTDESIITNVAGRNETEFSIDDLLQCSDASQHSSSLEQLHYLSDLADGFDFGCSYDMSLDLCWDDD
uniref:MADS-box domain-containing protein n=1 Tax=Oryza punctata TaxID=4537 RepID=A0A0E0JSN7_ORYPU